jgi:UMF1 family MFS transporter
MTASAVSGVAASKKGMSLSGWSWAIFEGGRDPYLILIVVYVFMPYFVSVMVGDPVKGQSMVADAAKLAGLIVALTAPVLGGVIDRGGRRKPALLLITAITAPLLASLWWARPDGSGLSITAVLFVAATLNVLLSYSGVAHNALLVPAAGRHAGRASGLALSLANVAGILSLMGVLWAFVLPGRVNWDFLPASPLLGLDPTLHEPDRVVAWVAAGLLLAGAIPITLFSKDLPATGASFRGSFVPALRDLRGMLKGLRTDRNIALYLLAYMFAADGIGSIAMFLGIYAAGVMKWGVMQMLFFAIWQSLGAGLGGLIGGQLDEMIGPKRTLQTALIAAILCTIGVITMSTHHIMLSPYSPEAGLHLNLGPLSLSLAEVVFLLLSSGTVFWVCAASSSGRTMLLLLTKPERSGAYFGLFALAGKATAWLGPFLVAWFTTAFMSQQMGFVPVVCLLIIGLTGISFVRPEKAT